MTDKTTSPLTGADRRRGIVSAIACLTVVAMGLGATLPLLALSLERQGVSPLLIGVSSAFPAIGGLLVTPVFPWFLRRFETRALLLTCVWISVGCLTAYYFVPNVWAWFPIRFLNGAVLSILFIVSETTINQLADDKTRGRLMGIYATVLAVGFATGPVLLVIVGSEGYPPYAVIALLVALASIPISLAGRANRHVTAHGQSRGVTAFLLVAPTATLAAFSFGALEQGSMTLLPVYGIRVGLTEQMAAMVLSAFAAGNILSQIPLGLIADRVDRRLVLIACALVGALTIAMLPLVQGSLLVMPVIFVFGGVVSGLYTIGLTLLGQRFRDGDLAAANAAFVMMYNVGGLVGPAIGGGAMEMMPPHGLPLAFAAISLLFAAVAGGRFLRLRARGQNTG
ncbi:MAG: MFS transporter [Parvibaculum sp.]|uniref:MFS transporter n=1 Tax=Parvibaculum sp. TaxID=2024848 RepID=UPI0025CC41C1|nr:MFS transporter [Parvibaculum sp.]MCE9648941.1 MFS transporter [Parvibaculum sp.]